MFLGLRLGTPNASSSLSVLQQLKQISGLTFFKNFRGTPSTLNADFSVGSATATFSVTRSTTSPATYTDGSGNIQIPQADSKEDIMMQMDFTHKQV